ncbi:MAG TPA: ion transporter [Pseudonocardiaceae bacterium]|jgi:voltage-gated sodium channel|nr:ion transporter [Pseudonocardiaceae bacterium]
MAWRERLRNVVDGDRFQRFIVAVIVLNAVTLGLETSERVVAQAGWLLHAVDRIALTIFVVELLTRLAAHGWRFFRDPWSVFDFVVIGIALIPASEAFSVLRALRILRVLRLVALVPSMRGVVAALLTAVPGMASIAALLGLLLYIAAVMATQLFGDAVPDRFGDLGTSLFTLFQVMTTDDWANVARAAMVAQPLAWIFFVVYLLVSTFAVLNLFIAVVVRAMEEQVARDVKADVAEHQRSDAVAAATILEEVRALRTEVAELRERA